MIIHDCAQQSHEWFALKAGKPSSSEFASLVTGLGKPSTSLPEYALKLATEKFLGAPIDDGFQGNRFTDRGIELEGEARADYAMTRQVEIQQVGFITDDLMRWGASTDGLVDDKGVAEFKSLIATRMVKLMVYMANNEGRTPPEYIPQLQGELFVTEREWVDIVFYHPQFDPIIHRHTPDPAFHKVLEAQLKKVITERNRIVKLIK